MSWFNIQKLKQIRWVIVGAILGAVFAHLSMLLAIYIAPSHQGHPNVQEKIFWLFAGAFVVGSTARHFSLPPSRPNAAAVDGFCMLAYLGWMCLQTWSEGAYTFRTFVLFSPLFVCGCALLVYGWYLKKSTRVASENARSC